MLSVDEFLKQVHEQATPKGTELERLVANAMATYARVQSEAKGLEGKIRVLRRLPWKWLLPTAAAVGLVGGGLIWMAQRSTGEARIGGETPENMRQSLVGYRLDLRSVGTRVGGAAERFVNVDKFTGEVSVMLSGGAERGSGSWAELVFDLEGTPARDALANNASCFHAEVRLDPQFRLDWERPLRARLFIESGEARQYLPWKPLVDRSQGWVTLSGCPSLDMPIAQGLTEPGFNGRFERLGIDMEASTREGPVHGQTIEIRDVRFVVGQAEPVVRLDRISPSPPPMDPGVVEGRFRELLRALPGDAVLAVNLPWPGATAPDGKRLQLYGRTLDAGEKWFDQYWDMGHPSVAASVRDDFRRIRVGFGGRPVLVRVFLFGDLRAGMTFADDGSPLAITERAKSNYVALLRVAKEEGVVLLPVLLDYLVADGVSKTGPNGTWAVGEHPDLLYDAHKRAKLLALLEQFIREAHSAVQGAPVLAVELMSEPSNAAALVTAKRIAQLERFLEEGVNAVHRAGEPVTIGFRDMSTAAWFMRRQLPIDLAQVHWWPQLRTRSNETPLSFDPKSIFDSTPAIWGELPARRGRIAGDFDEARRAGYRAVGFWNWRGDDETGDGRAVQARLDEIGVLVGLSRP